MAIRRAGARGCPVLRRAGPGSATIASRRQPIGRAGVCRVPSADRGRTEAEKGCRAPTVHRGVERRLRVGRVDAATAPLLLAALTDVRLVLGERLELRDDTDVQRLEVIVDTLAPDDPLVYAMVVYDFLTWLQETL